MNDRPSPRRSHWPVALAAILLIAALLAAFIFWRIESWPERTARGVRDLFLQTLHAQPRITVNNRIYFEETKPVAELALVSRRTEVDHEALHTWAGSTKRIKLHATFLVKAGFDLSEDFAVDIRPDAIDVHVPPAKILGVEQQQVEVLALENGLWNRISPEDVETELRTLPILARQQMQDVGLPAEAERSLQEQIERKLHGSQKVRLLVRPTVAPAG